MVYDMLQPLCHYELQAVREGRLSGAAGRSGSMVDTANQFYAGTFYAFYNR